MYGLATREGAFQQTKINVESSEPNTPFTISRGRITVNGMEAVCELIQQQILTRSTQYSAIILLPLVEKPRPYCAGIYSVNKGSDANKLLSVHRKVEATARETGIHIVTFPGDGDSCLRSIQWNYYYFKHDYAWLTNVTVPVEVFYNNSSPSKSAFPMQDLLHNIKKMRNQMKLTETRCMLLGIEPKRSVRS